MNFVCSPMRRIPRFRVRPRRRVRLRRVLPVLGTLAAPSIAHAHGGPESLFDVSPIYGGHWFAPVGVHAQYGIQNGQELADIGVELSAIRFLDDSGRIGRLVGFGAFLQTDVGLDAPGNAHLRVAAGLEATWALFGVQSGVVYRGLGITHGDSVGLYTCVFATMGIFSVGTYLEVPASLGRGATTDVAVGAMYTIKFPWDLGRRSDGTTQ